MFNGVVQSGVDITLKKSKLYICFSTEVPIDNEIILTRNGFYFSQVSLQTLVLFSCLEPVAFSLL